MAQEKQSQSANEALVEACEEAFQVTPTVCELFSETDTLCGGHKFSGDHDEVWLMPLGENQCGTRHVKPDAVPAGSEPAIVELSETTYIRFGSVLPVQLAGVTKSVRDQGANLARRLDRALLDLLVEACGEPQVRSDDVGLDAAIAQAADLLGQQGFAADGCLFPSRYYHRLKHMGIISRHASQHSSILAGYTPTGLKASVSGTLQPETCLVFDSSACLLQILSSEFKYLPRTDRAWHTGVGGFVTLLAVIRDVRACARIGGVDLAVKYIAQGKPVESGVETTAQTQFIDSERLSKLRGVASETFDLAALVTMCRELNACWQNGCYYSVAALGRTILNHVPPVFGCSDFREVCAQHGGKSVKATFAHLRDSLRNIADHHLHAQIGRTMALPNAVQVDFRASLDVLLAEVVKKLST